MTRFLISLLTASLLVTANAVSGELCFFDDFNSYPAGTPTGGFGQWELNRRTQAAWQVEIVADEGNVFTGTAKNQYLRFFNEADRGPILTARGVIPEKSVVTISFSAIFQEAQWPLRLYLGKGDASGETLAMLASFDNRDASQGTAHRFDVVFNHSSQAVAYEYGLEKATVAPQTMDIWRDGVRISEGGTSAGKLPAGEPLNTFVLRTSTGGEGKPLEAWLDWIAVFDGAAPGHDITKASSTYNTH